MLQLNLLEQIQSYIKKFEFFEENYPGSVRHSVTFKANKKEKHIAFCAIIHGDEIGALPAFLSMIEKFAHGKIKFDGQVTFFLGNVPAALQNKRFLERDLNRSFDLSQLHDDTTAERKRASELITLLNSCDLLFDFHQTSQLTHYPFYAFGFHYQSYLWARVAGCTPMFVTRPTNQKFSAGGLCIDEYMRSLNKPAVTLELSQRGFIETAKNITELVISRVLQTYQKMSNIQDIATLLKSARRNRNLTLLLTIYKEPFSHPRKALTPGFVNFSRVAKGQKLGTDENLQPILASDTGFLLFPKYPPRDEQGNSLENQTELFILVQSNS